MKLVLIIWRQKSRDAAGAFARYEVPDASPDMSFLELLDVLNERLITTGGQPIAFDHDCREGICGSCGMMINGVAHGPLRATATCQLHLGHFRDGDEIVVEPWRAAAFQVIKDLDGSASLFTAAKIAHLGLSPQGQPERPRRVLAMVAQMDREGFGNCSWHGECQAACPKSISIDTIARMSGDWLVASIAPAEKIAPS